MHQDGTGLRYRNSTKRDRTQYDSDWVAQHRHGLELSMHLPSGQRNNNRFELLRTGDRPVRGYHDYQSTAYHRPPRYGRGSREGKKRREARRSQRRHAAVRMLDQQLSRDFDRTLTQANIRKPEPLRVSKPATAPFATYHPPLQPAASYKLESEASWLNFGGLDLIGQQPQLPVKTYNAAASRSANAKNTYTNFTQHTPKVPPFFTDNVERKQFPLYFDLSSLPEPVDLPKPMLSKQELQIWRPSYIPRPKIQSGSPSFTHSMKHVPQQVVTACELHCSDRAVRDAATQTDQTTVLEGIKDATKMDAAGDFAEQFSATPANLWRILELPQKRNVDDCDPYATSFSGLRPNEEPDGISLLSDDAESEAMSKRCELDNTQIPFVHANSLTGHANERATFSLGDIDDDVVLYVSPEEVRTAYEPLTELNELVVDQWTEEEYADAVIAALDLPPLPSSPGPEAEIEAGLTAGSVVYTRSNNDEQPDNDKRCPNEQDLRAPPLPVLKPLDEDLVDITSLLDFTHSSDCWCAGCNDPPELLDARFSTDEEEEWMDFLTLTRSRSPSICSA